MKVTQSIDKPQPLIDIRNQVILARQHGLEPVFVVDPLNGLNRSEFMGLPGGWEASFTEPRVREAYRAFTLWILEAFEPRYLGLASEINTYADAHPQDFEHFLSLYKDTYAAIKQSRPQTRVFVTFQWEDLNNLIPAVTRRADGVSGQLGPGGSLRAATRPVGDLVLSLHRLPKRGGNPARLLLPAAGAHEQAAGRGGGRLHLGAGRPGGRLTRGSGRLPAGDPHADRLAHGVLDLPAADRSRSGLVRRFDGASPIGPR